MAILAGCSHSHPYSVGFAIQSASEMEPGHLPSKTADLVLAGTAYPVTIQPKTYGNLIRFDLSTHDEAIETEQYRNDPSSFSLVEADVEQCTPPIPLLKFPMNVGQSWDWSGTMTEAGIGRRATARINSSSDPLYYGGISHQTVKIEVKLSLDANPGKAPLERQLAFWFEPKVGIVKRQFGPASIRQPSSNP